MTSYIRIAFVGDTHGQLFRMWKSVLDWEKVCSKRIHYIIQVGDFGFWTDESRLDPPSTKHAKNHGYSTKEAVGDLPDILLNGNWRDFRIPIPTYFIRGNHEDQELLMAYERQNMFTYPKDYLERAIQIRENIYYIPDGHIVNISGLRVAGWGGCWAKKTWNLEYWGEQRAHKNADGFAKRLSHITRDRGERLIRYKFDVLVTHDAPVGSGVQGSKQATPQIDKECLTDDQEGGRGIPFLTELIESSEPLYQIGGHWHEYREYRIGNTQGFVLNKVGPDIAAEQYLKVLEFPIEW